MTAGKSMVRMAAVVVALGLAFGALALPAGSVYAASLDGAGGGRGGNGAGGNGSGGPAAGQVGSSAGTALTPLTEEESAGLQEAILEEMGALNLYSAVIDEFGSVIPFSQIVKSEQMHLNSLTRLAEKYGVEIPENPGLPAIDFATVTDACAAGVSAEIADAALYDTLMAFTTHSDLIRVYTNLQSASLNSHLPAFESCD